MDDGCIKKEINMARFVYTPDTAKISHNICRNATVQSVHLRHNLQKMLAMLIWVDTMVLDHL